MVEKTDNEFKTEGFNYLKQKLKEYDADTLADGEGFVGLMINGTGITTISASRISGRQLIAVIKSLDRLKKSLIKTSVKQVMDGGSAMML